MAVLCLERDRDLKPSQLCVNLQPSWSRWNRILEYAIIYPYITHILEYDLTEYSMLYASCSLRSTSRWLYQYGISYLVLHFCRLPCFPSGCILEHAAPIWSSERGSSPIHDERRGPVTAGPLSVEPRSKLLTYSLGC